MKQRFRTAIFWFIVAFGGALGGVLQAWAGPHLSPGRLVLLSVVTGLVVALLSHLLLWRRKAFQLQRTLAPIIFFTWQGTVGVVLSRWHWLP